MAARDIDIAASVSDRAGALATLCTLRPLPGDVLADADVALVRLLRTTVDEVRRTVAVRLADCSWAPVEAVRMLAFDRIEIARPLIERSIQLPDTDLEALAEFGRVHRLAIARRPQVSERISSAIAAKREPECLEALAANPGAQLGDACAPHFGEVARGAPALQQALMDRKDLRPALVRALAAVAGDAVKTEILERWPEIRRDLLDAEVEAAVRALSPDTSGALVERLDAKKRLSAADLLRAAEGGRTDELDHVAAKLTGSDSASWRRALARSPLRAALLCARATAMPCESARRFHAALARLGRVHSVGSGPLEAASTDIYTRYDRDDARRALLRLGASASIH